MSTRIPHPERHFPPTPPASFPFEQLAANLTLTRAELQVVREFNGILRSCLQGVRDMAAVDAIHGSARWQAAVERMDVALRLTE